MLMYFPTKQTIALVLVYCCILSGCFIVSLGLKNQAQPALLTTQDFLLEVNPIGLDTGRPLSAFIPLMDQLLVNDKLVKHFILYVHGRGAHPGKAIRSRVLADMEATYDAKVLMFRWPSWIRFDVRPHYNAQNSGIYLRTVLKAFSDYKADFQQRFPEQTIVSTLIAHSMGNIVLQNAVLAQQPSLVNDLFNRVLLVAADVDASGHDEWLSQLNFSRHIDVLANRNDYILQTVNGYLDRPRLGNRFALKQQFPIFSKNARYIDLTGQAIQHEYHFGTLRPAAVKKLFTDLVQDRPDNLSPYSLMNGEFIYQLDEL